MAGTEERGPERMRLCSGLRARCPGVFAGDTSWCDQDIYLFYRHRLIEPMKLWPRIKCPLSAGGKHAYRLVFTARQLRPPPVCEPRPSEPWGGGRSSIWRPGVKRPAVCSAMAQHSPAIWDARVIHGHGPLWVS